MCMMFSALNAGFPKYNSVNYVNFRCGNYDGDDDETCDDYDPDEDLEKMFDKEDYDELHES